MSAIIGTAIGGLVTTIAGKIGARLVKKAVEGGDGLAGVVIGKIIDKVGERLGRAVKPDEAGTLTPAELEPAVAAVEAEMPEILLAWNEQQRAAHDMMRAEMDKGGDAWWTWAWRPAGMWLFLLLVLWYALVFPIVNFYAAWGGLPARLETVLDVASFVALFMFFAGFYMGGHTAKDFFTKAAAALGQWRGGK